MSSGRRDFLGKAAAVTAALGARALPLAAQRAATMPPPRASALTALFGLKYPIRHRDHETSLQHRQCGTR